MRTFDNFPQDRKCRLCGTNEDKPCVLIPVDGTQVENRERAVPMHADCLADDEGFRFNDRMSVIYKMTMIMEDE